MNRIVGRVYCNTVILWISVLIHVSVVLNGIFCFTSNRYYSEFLESVFYVKHQIDILSQLQLVDLLYNDTALSYFTEVLSSARHLIIIIIVNFLPEVAMISQVLNNELHCFPGYFCSTLIVKVLK